MRRVLHVLDAAADWEQRVAVGHLLDRAPKDGVSQHLVTIDPQARSAEWFNGCNVQRAPCRFDAAILAAPALRRLIERLQIDTVHAWGIRSAMAAAAAKPEHAGLIVQRFDPSIADHHTKFLRTAARRGRFALACAAGTVLRRLVERGVPTEACALIRPGVDFKRINHAKRDHALRRRLGIGRDDRIILAPPPIGRRVDCHHVLHAGHLLHVIDPRFRVLIYGDTAEARRVRRIAADVPFANSDLWPGCAAAYEELVAIASCHVVAPQRADVPVTSIAWAMAAAVPVIGSAVYSVAELIAHRSNGQLFKPEPGPAMAVRIAECVNRIDDTIKEREAARGQAYETFGIRRFVDQTLRLYDNVARGDDASTDISDSAVES